MQKSGKSMLVLGSAVAATVATVALAQVTDDRVTFPADYATTFTNYVSVDRQNGNQVSGISAHGTE